jgi:hypothetical protein
LELELVDQKLVEGVVVLLLLSAEALLVQWMSAEALSAV